MRRQSRLPAATRSLHVRRASPEEGSGTGASYMQLLPLVAPAPNLSRLPACSFKAHQGAPYEDNANPEQLPTGLSFCTKVNGFDPSKRVAGLQGILRLQLPVKPPGGELVMTMNDSMKEHCEQSTLPKNALSVGEHSEEFSAILTVTLEMCTNRM